MSSRCFFVCFFNFILSTCLFIFGYAGSLAMVSRGYSLVAMSGLLISVVSLVVEQGL